MSLFIVKKWRKINLLPFTDKVTLCLLWSQLLTQSQKQDFWTQIQNQGVTNTFACMIIFKMALDFELKAIEESMFKFNLIKSACYIEDCRIYSPNWVSPYRASAVPLVLYKMLPLYCTLTKLSSSIGPFFM